MSPEVRTALDQLIDALQLNLDADLWKVGMVDFDAKRYTGAVVSSETREVLSELALKMNRY